MALEAAIASEVAEAIGVRLSSSEREQMTTTRSVDPDVYEAYLQGKYYGEQFSEESLRKAEGYFKRAIAKDASFAPAWVGLSDALQWMALYHVEPESLLPEAAAATDRALSLDPNLAEAHASKASLLQTRWHWQEADSEIRRALQLNPNSAAAHRRLWMLLACSRRLPEALAEIEIAKKLDPLSAKVSAGLGVQFLFMKRYDEAIAELESALALDPGYTLAHVYLFLAYSELNKDPERGEELQYYVADLARPELIPEYQRRLKADGYSKALHWMATTLDADPPVGASRIGVIAGLLAQAGEHDRAIYWLERGYSERAWDLGWLAIAPDYSSLRGDPRFESLLHMIGLPGSGS